MNWVSYFQRSLEEERALLFWRFSGFSASEIVSWALARRRCHWHLLRMGSVSSWSHSALWEGGQGGSYLLFKIIIFVVIVCISFSHSSHFGLLIFTVGIGFGVCWWEEERTSSEEADWFCFRICFARAGGQLSMQYTEAASGCVP